MNEKKQVRVIIGGMVQGVCFRMETRKTAKKMNITGWVRNCSDGSVEGIFEGEKSDLDQMIQWCHRGSPGSLIDQVKADWTNTISGFTDFRIRF